MKKIVTSVGTTSPSSIDDPSHGRSCSTQILSPSTSLPHSISLSAPSRRECDEVKGDSRREISRQEGEKLSREGENFKGGNKEKEQNFMRITSERERERASERARERASEREGERSSSSDTHTNEPVIDEERMRKEEQNFSSSSSFSLQENFQGKGNHSCQSLQNLSPSTLPLPPATSVRSSSCQVLSQNNISSLNSSSSFLNTNDSIKNSESTSTSNRGRNNPNPIPTAKKPPIPPALW